MDNGILYSTLTGVIFCFFNGNSPPGHDEDNLAYLPTNLRKCDSDNYYVNLNTNTITEYTSQEKEIIRSYSRRSHEWKMPERQLIDIRTIQQARDDKWQNVKRERSLRENSTFTYNGNTYDADKEHIPGAAQLALLAKSANQPFSINWTLANNSVVTLNADEMIAVGAALGSFINSIYDTARSLRDQIEQATTISEVDAIAWP